MLKYSKCCKIEVIKRIAVASVVAVLVFCLWCGFATSETCHVASYPLPPIVAIDAGHGGIDRGACGNGLFEADLNLAISKKVESELAKLNVFCVLTRKTENGLYGTTLPGFKKRDMNARKAIIERSGANFAVSIHMNASDISDRTGVVIYCDMKDANSVALAKSIATQFEKVSVKNGDFFMTTKIGVPAVLVECGFITTASEAKLLNDEEYQNKLANLIARGILVYNRYIEK